MNRKRRKGNKWKEKKNVEDWKVESGEGTERKSRKPKKTVREKNRKKGKEINENKGKILKTGPKKVEMEK